MGALFTWSGRGSRRAARSLGLPAHVSAKGEGRWPLPTYHGWSILHSAWYSVTTRCWRDFVDLPDIFLSTWPMTTGATHFHPTLNIVLDCTGNGLPPPTIPVPGCSLLRPSATPWLLTRRRSPTPLSLLYTFKSPFIRWLHCCSPDLSPSDTSMSGTPFP